MEYQIGQEVWVWLDRVDRTPFRVDHEVEVRALVDHVHEKGVLVTTILGDGNPKNTLTTFVPNRKVRPYDAVPDDDQLEVARNWYAVRLAYVEKLIKNRAERVRVAKEMGA
jgi:hypothetical protein